MMKIRKITTGFMVLLLTFLSTVRVAMADEVLSLEQYEKARTADELLTVLEDIFQWKKSQEGISTNEKLLSGEMLEYAGSSALDWYVLAMGRCGYEENYEDYASAMKEQILKKYKTADKLDANSATEWHRQIVTLLAVGEEPEYIVDDMGNVINLVADGTYDRGKTKDLGEQGLNGYIWALIAMDAKDYQVPSGACDTREAVLTTILTGQNADGGFALVEGISDVDMTAMALQAMAPYYEDETTFSIEGQEGLAKEITVKQVVEEALDYLSGCQLENGAMGYDGEAVAESTAQVITALSCLGIDLREDERFVKNDKNLLDGMLLFRNDDGGFSHLLSDDERESNSLVGEQVALAMVAYVRCCLGENCIYDFGGENFQDENIKENPLLLQYWQLEQEIATINRQIQEQLYPFENMSKEDRMLASELVEKIHQLPDYVRDEILEYDKLCKAAEEKENGFGVVLGIVSVVVVLGIATIYRITYKNIRKEDDWDE